MNFIFTFLKPFNSCRKAPEFQCHIKYKNELPLPPVSAVLMDVSLCLPQESLQTILKTESTVYKPTSLEQGMKYFTLPADLLRSSFLSNTVDLDAFKGVSDSSLAEDKELLLPIDELERKFKSTNTTATTFQNTNTTNTTFNTTNTTNTSTATSNAINSSSTSSNVPAKFARPDVTWLRRTEYISAVKTSTSAPSSAHSLSVNDAKALLEEPVAFSQIVQEVEETFEATRASVPLHPFKPEVSLLQSFPLKFASGLEDGYAHCLFLGDNSCNENSILKVESEHIVSLFNQTEQESDSYKSQGHFDIQRSDSSTTKKASHAEKGLVLMLPMDMKTDSSARLVKINSNFSLRRRRSAASKFKNRGIAKRTLKISRNPTTQ